MNLLTLAQRTCPSLDTKESSTKRVVSKSRRRVRGVTVRLDRTNNLIVWLTADLECAHG